MKEYTTPTIELISFPDEDVLTASGEGHPMTFPISQPANASTMSRYILNLDNSYKYLSLRKVWYKTFLKIYQKNGFIDFSLNPDEGILEWKIELPFDFVVSADESIGDLIERMKTIESNSLQWHCSWLHKKLLENGDILPPLYVPNLTDDDIANSYIAVPSLSSITSWLDYCNFIRNLIAACNVIDMPMSYLQTSRNTYSVPIPVYTATKTDDGTTYEFYTNILLTVQEV